MERFTLHQGDCLDVMATFEPNSIDTIITDPPYGLTFMGKDWDRGVPGVAFWREALRVAKPGAMLLAMGGTRTYHRLVCAIEDAGWEIRDSMAWLYGSGFPKSHNIGKAIDKRGGYPQLAGIIGDAIKKARESRGLSIGECDKLFCGGTTNWSWFEGRPAGQRAPTPQTFSVIAERWPELAALASKVEEAEREVVGSDTKARSTSGKSALPTVGGSTVYETWDITAPATEEAQLWDGWGTALKPAMELICVAQKPIDGTYAENALAWGVAGLHIDGCRVPCESRPKREIHPLRDDVQYNPNSIEGRVDGSLQSSKAVGETTQGRWPANVIHDGSDEVLALFPETGASKVQVRNQAARPQQKAKGAEKACTGVMGHNDNSGSAARFFYCAKASRSERNEGLEDITNNHPTVKALALMTYLCRLTETPTGGVVLDPFMGSGTTGCGCAEAGRDFIGIELEPPSFEIAKGRIEHWYSKPRQIELL